MASKTETFVSKFPRCDFCGQEAHYDAKTKSGPWAYMCEQCFKTQGVGLGLGMGQKLMLRGANIKQCILAEAGVKPSKEGFKEAVEKCKPKTFMMTEGDLEQAVMDGIWYPKCPYCGENTSAEPDASYIYCDNCEQRFKIINPYF